MYFCGAGVSRSSVDNDIDTAVFEALRQIEPEPDAGVGTDGINLDADTVFMKEGITVLFEKGDGSVSFFNQPFNGKNIVDLEAFLIEKEPLDFGGNGLKTKVMETVYSCRVVFADPDVDVDFPAVSFFVDGAVYLTEKIAFIGVKLFYEGDILVKLFGVEWLFCPAKEP